MCIRDRHSTVGLFPTFARRSPHKQHIYPTSGTRRDERPMFSPTLDRRSPPLRDRPSHQHTHPSSTSRRSPEPHRRSPEPHDRRTVVDRQSSQQYESSTTSRHRSPLERHSGPTSDRRRDVNPAEASSRDQPSTGIVTQWLEGRSFQQRQEAMRPVHRPQSDDRTSHRQSQEPPVSYTHLTLPTILRV